MTDQASVITEGSIGRAFKPRRLGHTNINVAKLAKSIEFYQEVVGFDLVYRKLAPSTGAEENVVGAFFSNGNTYHDLACFEDGVGGKLNHSAFECPTEVALLAGYERAVEAGVAFKTSDHVVARSLYTSDPDGNGVEMYSDTTPEWRRLRGDGRTVPAESLPWTPGDPSNYTSLDAENYPDDPVLVRLEHSAFQAKRMRYAALASHDAENLVAYYRAVVGLELLAEGSDHAVLGGSIGAPSIVVYQVPASAKTGFHHMGVEVWDVEAGLSRLEERSRDSSPRGVQLGEGAAVLRDPDGIPVALIDSALAGAGGVSEVAAKVASWAM